ncbi:winged helix-turn-helix domain-containing protein [Pseudoalteromonas sp. PS5]|uniref:winged helix-turn-helix domain-containing protein n=1 Tax=Pseudoalteromonas sp. PS5 TaxID=1437473 RepID=UPI000FFE9F9C|nr:winged helix-turn-helix domain-containing protein [Pseudoalteromonas sp. PS5]RXE95311.1 CadC family transcriptional regulator [Pseudoalteromonas sp. PS5]
MQYQLNQKWHFDVSSRTISHNETCHTLTPLSHRLLLTLIEHAPNLVTYQQLEQQVWLGRIVTHDAIKKQIARLRKQLNDDAIQPEYIVSERSFGYRLSATVEKVNHQPLVPTTKRFSIITVSAISFALLCALGIYQYSLTSSKHAENTVMVLSVAQQHVAQETAEDNLRAITLYQQSINTSPAVIESYKGLSQALLDDYKLYNQTGDALEQSLINAKKALDLTPTSPSAQRLQAQAHALQGRYSLAQQQLTDMVADTPDWPLLKANLAKSYLSQGNTINAYPLARQAYESSSSEPKIVATYLNCLRKMYMNHWFENVYNNVSPTVKASPWVQLEYIKLLQQQGKHKTATQQLNVLASTASHSQALNWFTALSYLSEYHHKQAVDTLSLTVEKQGKYALFSRLYLSLLTAQPKLINRYQNDILTLIEAGNQDPELVFSLGLISLYHQHNVKAKRYFKQAILLGFSDEFRFKALPFNLTAEQAHFIDIIIQQLNVSNLKRRIKRTPK